MDRLDEITKDCFNALTQLRQLDPASQPPPEVLHQRLRSYVDAMIRKADEAGFPREDTQDITYAIVALLDEAVLLMPSARQYWQSRPLQLHYFNENLAGENFFTRLEAMLSDMRRLDVIRAYYLCLMFGFQGRYRVRGGEIGLGQVTELVMQRLQQAKVIGQEQLSPHGERPQEARGQTRKDLPLVGISLAVLVVAIGVYFGLRLSLSSEVNSVVQRIGSLHP